MIVRRRGMGAGAIDAANPITQSAAGTVNAAAASSSGLTYGPSLSQLGITGSSDIPTDAPLTCAQIIQAGVDVSGTDCASVGSYLAALPSWAIPAAVGGFLFLLMLGGRRR